MSPYRGGAASKVFEICEKSVWVKVGGRCSHFSAQSCTLDGAHEQALHSSITFILNHRHHLRCFLSAGQASVDVCISRFSPHPQCRAKIPAVKPWWGIPFNPKTGLQKQWPQQFTECGALWECMQVAGTRQYNAFWPGCQAQCDSPAPTLHPQSEFFCAPKAFVVHRGKQQHGG